MISVYITSVPSLVIGVFIIGHSSFMIWFYFISQFSLKNEVLMLKYLQSLIMHMTFMFAKTFIGILLRLRICINNHIGEKSRTRQWLYHGSMIGKNERFTAIWNLYESDKCFMSQVWNLLFKWQNSRSVFHCPKKIEKSPPSSKQK